MIAKPTHPRFIDIAGQSFGRLVVVEYAGRNKGYSIWRCRCACGKECTVTVQRLRNGSTQSCGCLQRERTSLASIRHGAKRFGRVDPIYPVWQMMIQRCENPRNRAFHNYGGRGIRVCERWHVFANFRDDMGPRPSRSHCVERRDNEGDYCPENCCWATRVQQARNTRRNRFLTWRCQTKTLSEWAEVLGVKPLLIWNRLKRGWSVEAALSTPLRGA